MADIFIAGVPFMALGHHDGRFVRAPGLFAFARREVSGVYTVLHLELTTAINRQAGSGHGRWSWAIGEGMDSLLIHLFGRLAQVPADADPALETVLWHPDVQAILLTGDRSETCPALPKVAQRRQRP